MADTSRSKADLIAELPDNVTGLITPQDMRDIVVSLLGSHAEMLTIEGVTTQTVSGTPQKMTGWSSNGIGVGCSSDFTANEITIDVDGVYDANWEICFSGSSSDVFYCALYKNGADAGLAYIDRKMGTGGDVDSSSMGGRVNCAAGDLLSVYVWSDTGGVSFLPHNASLRVKRIG